MQNTSTVGLPPNCKNWLALGAVVFGSMRYTQALRIIGLKNTPIEQFNDRKRAERENHHED